MDEGNAAQAAALLELNLSMGEQERLGKKGREFFDGLLDERFQFRRGDGSLVNKEDFLKGLGGPANQSEILTSDVRQVQVLGDQAFVEVWVYLKGTRRGKPVDGMFRNLRLFELATGKWRCVMWFNKPLA